MVPADLWRSSSFSATQVKRQEGTRVQLDVKWFWVQFMMNLVAEMLKLAWKCVARCGQDGGRIPGGEWEPREKYSALEGIDREKAWGGKKGGPRMKGLRGEA